MREAGAIAQDFTSPDAGLQHAARDGFTHYTKDGRRIAVYKAAPGGGSIVARMYRRKGKYHFTAGKASKRAVPKRAKPLPHSERSERSERSQHATRRTAPGYEERMWDERQGGGGDGTVQRMAPAGASRGAHASHEAGCGCPAMPEGEPTSTAIVVRRTEDVVAYGEVSEAGRRRPPRMKLGISGEVEEAEEGGALRWRVDASRTHMGERHWIARTRFIDADIWEFRDGNYEARVGDGVNENRERFPSLEDAKRHVQQLNDIAARNKERGGRGTFRGHPGGMNEARAPEGHRLFDMIRPGDRVTIVNRFGQQHTGKAVMLGPGGWVLNMGGQHGTPAIATDDNITNVKRPRARETEESSRVEERGIVFLQRPDGVYWANATGATAGTYWLMPEASGNYRVVWSEKGGNQQDLGTYPLASAMQVATKDDPSRRGEQRAAAPYFRRRESYHVGDRVEVNLNMSEKNPHWVPATVATVDGGRVWVTLPSGDDSDIYSGENLRRAGAEGSTSGEVAAGRKRQADPKDPDVYLSFSEGKYRVIDHGVPISADKATSDEALAVAKHYNLAVSNMMWNGDIGQWAPLWTRGPAPGGSMAEAPRFPRRHEDELVKDPAFLPKNIAKTYEKEFKKRGVSVVVTKSITTSPRGWSYGNITEVDVPERSPSMAFTFKINVAEGEVSGIVSEGAGLGRVVGQARDNNAESVISQLVSEAAGEAKFRGGVEAGEARGAAKWIRVSTDSPKDAKTLKNYLETHRHVTASRPHLESSDVDTNASRSQIDAAIEYLGISGRVEETQGRGAHAAERLTTRRRNDSPTAPSPCPIGASCRLRTQPTCAPPLRASR